MPTAPIDFDALPWQTPLPGVRFKTVVHGGQKLRLMEFASGFAEQHWCGKAHVGWVIEGEFELRFTGGARTYRAGQGVFLEAGHADKHKVRVTGAKALLILVEPDIPELAHPHSHEDGEAHEHDDPDAPGHESD
jgi:hypothetical protein